MKIEFVAAVDAAEILAVPVHEDRVLAGSGSELDEQSGGALTRAMSKGRFVGKAGQTLMVAAVSGAKAESILLVGAGSADKIDDLAVEAFGGNAYAAVKLSGAEVLTIDASNLSPEQAARVGFAVRLAAYRFDKYRTTQKPDKIPSINTVRVVTSDLRAAEAALEPLTAVADGVIFARDLVSEPANVLYPAEFARRVKALESLGLEVEILGEAEMEKLGMRTLLGVGQGSSRPPRLLAVRYRGQGASSDGPIALLGKGITFDSGGISIKPGANMGNMKMDMSGAASVVGAVLALAKGGAPVDVVAVAALAENMPDGNAIRPADVLTAMNGKTIEIISTDAEGRLVLADAVVWADTTLNPAAIVDVATLTGSVGGALGNDYAGLFSRHDALADQLKTAGDATGETLWRLPLHPSYVRATSSTIADIKNSGDGGAGAGTGAHFIGYFARPETPWAHLDIANMAFGGASDVKPAGSAGYSVRLLERFVRDFQPVAREKGTGGY
ncbi:hypothetical protein LTR94_021355 [Friedmanniomyces endolithicus]|nr:hypothetical protein LTR94_021355 [Friedmanniomyces endolithicus]